MTKPALTDNDQDATDVIVKDGFIIIPLTKPIPDANGDDGDELTVLKMREPVGADTAAVGVPVKLMFDPEVGMDGDMSVDIVASRMKKMAARLSDQPGVVIGKMSAKDTTRMHMALLPYFFG